MKEALQQEENLGKLNKELCQWMNNQEQKEGHPFSREMMDEKVPPHFMVSKVPPSLGTLIWLSRFKC